MKILDRKISYARAELSQSYDIAYVDPILLLQTIIPCLFSAARGWIECVRLILHREFLKDGRLHTHMERKSSSLGNKPSQDSRTNKLPFDESRTERVHLLRWIVTPLVVYAPLFGRLGCLVELYWTQQHRIHDID